MNPEYRSEQNYHGSNFKMKSNLINKFASKHADPLDFRLDNTKSTFASFHKNPLEIKQEEEILTVQVKYIEHPLDYSEVQIATSEMYPDHIYEHMPPLICKSDPMEVNLDNQNLQTPWKSFVKTNQPSALRTDICKTVHKQYEEDKMNYFKHVLRQRYPSRPGSPPASHNRIYSQPHQLIKV